MKLLKDKIALGESIFSYNNRYAFQDACIHTGGAQRTIIGM